MKIKQYMLMFASITIMLGSQNAYSMKKKKVRKKQPSPKEQFKTWATEGSRLIKVQKETLDGAALFYLDLLEKFDKDGALLKKVDVNKELKWELPENVTIEGYPKLRELIEKKKNIVVAGGFFGRIVPTIHKILTNRMPKSRLKTNSSHEKCPIPRASTPTPMEKSKLKSKKTSRHSKCPKPRKNAPSPTKVGKKSKKRPENIDKLKISGKL